MHNGKSQMKIQEDPWENYLYYDSKYVLPLICHGARLRVEEQLIVSMFVLNAIQEGTISQFKSVPAILLADLLSFISKQEIEEEQEDDDADEEETSLMDKVRECCKSDDDLEQDTVRKVYSDLQRAFKMFFLQQQMTGKLKEQKDDYFV
jgi:hypothetical protein